MRTFIAIPLPPDARNFLAEIQKKLRAFGADVRWTAVPSIHLTLKFLGEIEPATLPGLSASLRSTITSELAFTIRIRGLGAFPDLRNPRVIWCGLEGDLQRVAALQEKVEAACLAAGFPREDRPFHPHLTLGRVRGKSNLKPLVDYIKIGSELEQAVAVGEFNIYQSILRPEGPLYTILDTFNLGSH